MRLSRNRVKQADRLGPSILGPSNVLENSTLPRDSRLGLKTYASEGANNLGSLYISIEQDEDKIKYKPVDILLLYTLLNKRRADKDDNNILELEEIQYAG